MAGRWKFSVTVPSWTQTTLEGDELVVFYRVEVKILPPDGKGLPKTRTVLRRYNHFHKLHAKIQEELGHESMHGKEVPNKRSIFRVNKRPELIERRRKELQQWLWKLVNDPILAQSQSLNAFLELSDAAKLVARNPSTAASLRTAESLPRPYTMSEGGSSPRGSEASGFTAASQFSRVAESQASVQPPLPADLPTPRPSADFRRAASVETSRSERRAIAEVSLPESAHRLGLRVDQRGALKRTVKELQDRLTIATEDFQNMAEAIEAEKEAKRHLAQRVAYLENELGPDHAVKEAELERLLQQVVEMDSLTNEPAFLHRRKPSEGVHSLQEVSRKLESLKSDLDANRKAREALQEENLSLQQQTVDQQTTLKNLERDLEKVREIASESQAEEIAKLRLDLEAQARERQSKLEAEHAERLAELQSKAQANLQSIEKEWQSKHVKLQEEYDRLEREQQSSANSSQESSEKALAEAEQKATNDKKVLAKAIKGLRKQVADYETRLNDLEAQKIDSSSIQRELEDAQASLQTEVNARTASEALLADLRSQLDANKQSQASLQADMETRLSQAQEQNARLQAGLEAAEARAQTVEQEAQLSQIESRQSLVAKQKEVEGLQQRLVDLQRSAAEAENRAKQMAEAASRDKVSRIAELEERLRETSAQLQESDSNFASMFSSQDAQTTQLSALESEKAQLTASLASLQSAHAERESQLAEALSEKDVKSQELQKLQIELAEKDAAVQTAQEARDSALAEVASAQEAQSHALQELQTQLADSDAAKNAAQAEKQQLESQLQATERDTQGIKAREGDLTAKIEHLQQQLQDAEKWKLEAQKLEEELARLQSEHAPPSSQGEESDLALGESEQNQGTAEKPSRAPDLAEDKDRSALPADDQEHAGAVANDSEDKDDSAVQKEISDDINLNTEEAEGREQFGGTKFILKEGSRLSELDLKAVQRVSGASSGDNETSGSVPSMNCQNTVVLVRQGQCLESESSGSAQGGSLMSASTESKTSEISFADELKYASSEQMPIHERDASDMVVSLIQRNSLIMQANNLPSVPEEILEGEVGEHSLTPGLGSRRENGSRSIHSHAAQLMLQRQNSLPHDLARVRSWNADSLAQARQMISADNGSQSLSQNGLSSLSTVGRTSSNNQGMTQTLESIGTSCDPLSESAAQSSPRFSLSISADSNKQTPPQLDSLPYSDSAPSLKGTTLKSVQGIDRAILRAHLQHASKQIGNSLNLSPRSSPRNRRSSSSHSPRSSSARERARQNSGNRGSLKGSAVDIFAGLDIQGSKGARANSTLSSLGDEPSPECQSEVNKVVQRQIPIVHAETGLDFENAEMGDVDNDLALPIPSGKFRGLETAKSEAGSGSAASSLERRLLTSNAAKDLEGKRLSMDAFLRSLAESPELSLQAPDSGLFRDPSCATTLASFPLASELSQGTLPSVASQSAAAGPLPGGEAGAPQRAKEGGSSMAPLSQPSTYLGGISGSDLEQLDLLAANALPAGEPGSHLKGVPVGVSDFQRLEQATDENLSQSKQQLAGQDHEEIAELPETLLGIDSLLDLGSVPSSPELEEDTSARGKRFIDIDNLDDPPSEAIRSQSPDVGHKEVEDSARQLSRGEQVGEMIPSSSGPSSDHKQGSADILGDLETNLAGKQPEDAHHDSAGNDEGGSKSRPEQRPDGSSEEGNEARGSVTGDRVPSLNHAPVQSSKESGSAQYSDERSSAQVWQQSQERHTPAAQSQDPVKPSQGQATAAQQSSLGGFMSRWGLSLPSNSSAGQQGSLAMEKPKQNPTADKSKSGASGYQNVLNKDKIESFARSFIRKSNN